MKKYQTLIKDNIDLFSETENELMRIINDPHDYDPVIFEGHLRSVFLASGALEVIDADYDYSKLSARTAHILVNLLTVFASNSRALDIPHELVMRCLNLSRETKDNLHYHARRSLIFND